MRARRLKRNGCYYVSLIPDLGIFLLMFRHFIPISSVSGKKGDNEKESIFDPRYCTPVPIVIKGERTKKGSVTTSNRRKKERRKKWTG